MSTKVEIANVALTLLGEPDISDLSEAEAIQAVWNPARQAALRGHPWNFAMSEATLPAMVVPTGKMWKWGFAHPVPTDYLRLVDVEGLDGAYERKRINGKQVICTNSSPINISYIADVTAESEFDALFVLAFAKNLAELAAVRITGSETALENIDALYRKMIAGARGVDAQENGQDMIVADDWNNSRG